MELTGFGNHHQSEAISGTLPLHQNSPQHCPKGLYAEQLSGSAFTRPRAVNLHSWLYRVLPSVAHPDFKLHDVQIHSSWVHDLPPNALRWSAPIFPQEPQDWLDGLFHVAGSTMVNAYHYVANQSMTQRFFSNRDGDLLFVPYEGTLLLKTELGHLRITPGMIAVIPRGIVFQVMIEKGPAAGYVCENMGLPFSLPPLGAIGANGLAHPRHFVYPHAAYELTTGNIELICKSQHKLWSTISPHSPLNVIAWHGNYAPFSYDLSLFNTINTVSYDHPDPSIFTVLTSESEILGIANLDFVIFPPRWMVAEHTFRPPYFHRNIMSEFMGLIRGEYDAKAEGFERGGISIHNNMMAHGPDAASYQAAIAAEMKPTYYANTLAFMFETRDPWNVTEQAYHHRSRQQDYTSCWKTLKPASLNQKK